MGPSDSPVGVVLGADSLLLPRSGIGRMTLEIAEAVRDHPGVAGLRLLLRRRLADAGAPGVAADADAALAAGQGAGGPRAPLAGRLKQLIGPLPGVRHAWAAKSALLLYAELRRFRAEMPGGVVYHEPNMIPAPFRGTTVVTVNDLSWHHHPDMHPRERIRWIERNLRRTLAQAARFVAISEFTAAALAAEFGVPRERIDVVPLAASSSFVPVPAADAAPALVRHGLADRGYVLSVSTVEPRKNFDRLLAAHLALPGTLRRRFPLAVVGGSGWGRALESPHAAAARADGSLRLLGHVPDSELAPLLARAACFAYVSLYEGFGLPVVEAMAAGTPVVASASTAVGETAGSAALLVDPLDPGAIAAALRAVLEDPARADALRALGTARAAGYTWRRTADRLVASWRRALAG